MKYILEKDLMVIFKSNRNVIISFLIMSVLYAMFVTIINNFDISEMTYGLFYSNIGGNHNISSIYEYIILLLNVATYTFIILKIITIDLSYEKEYIFLRMRQSKWMIRKIASIIISMSILTLTVNIILFAYYSLIGVQFRLEMLINIIVVSTLCKLNLCLLILLLFQVFDKMVSFIIVFIYSMLYINYNSFNIKEMEFLKILFPSNNNIIFSIIILVVLIMICMILSSKSYTKFERC
jgi:hypothetical protein